MLKNISKLLILTLILVFLNSCISSKKINYMQSPSFNIPAYKDSISYSDYRLRIGDRLYVKVYSTDQKTNSWFNGSNTNSQVVLSSTQGTNLDLYTYKVENDGNINFPMIGNVKIEGKTIREATIDLEKAIEPIFKYSTAEIRIVGRNFSVIGGKTSGFFPIPREKINIFEALALAGDINTYGDRSKIRILRETEKGVIVKTFDIRSSDIINSEFYYIEPNDVIYIQNLEEQFFSITNLPILISTIFSTFSMGVLIVDSYNKLTTSLK